MALPDLYVHRSLAHNQVKFSPILSNLVKIIFWSRMFWYRESDIKYWVAIHRKHHSFPDTVEDPHSPHFYDKKFLILKGRTRIEEEDAVKFLKNYQYPRSILDNIFEKFPYGPYVFFAVLTLCFGWWGLLAWVVLMSTAYYSSIGNVMFHTFPGYRNVDSLKSSDRSRNLWPIGIPMGGEELHGNHHRWPNRANFAVRHWEVDAGYCILWLLEKVKLVKILTNNPIENTELKAKRYK